MTAQKLTWPEYREIQDAVDIFTGAKHDPANQTLKEIFDEAKAQQRPMSVKEQEVRQQRIAEAEERRKRMISRYDMQEHFESFGYLRRTGHYSIVNVVREERGELERWEKKAGASLRDIGLLASESLSDKKLDNRIERFREAAQRMNTLANLMEERQQRENAIRRIK